MQYYPRKAIPFWVEMVISKGDGHIETASAAERNWYARRPGPDFQKAPIHTTIFGLRMTSRLTSGSEETTETPRGQGL